MRFSDHYGLNEKIAYGKEYQVPKDKKHRLYDFYANTMFYPADKVFDPDKHEEEIYYFNDAIQKITDALIQDFKLALRFALSAELGHFGDTSNQITDVIAEEAFAKEYSKEIKKLQRKLGISSDRYTKSSYGARYEVFKEIFPDDYDLQEFAEKVFDEDLVEWEDSYGGDKWYKIAKGYRRLLNAENAKLGDKIVAVDHVYDLQHNNDTVFNKIKQYQKDGSHSWVLDALDHKKEIKEPHIFIKHVSDAFKRPLTAALKITEKMGVDKGMPEPNYDKLVNDMMSDWDDDGKVIKNKDGSYTIKDATMEVTQKLVEDGELIVQFKTVDDIFDVADIGLKTLKGCPTTCVKFDATENKITNLEGGPKNVEGFYDVYDNPKLVSLKGGPDKCGSFDARDCNLKSLVGGPKYVQDEYDVSGNSNLKSIQGLPTKAGKEARLIISDTGITTLKGIAKIWDEINAENTNIPEDEIVDLYRSGVNIYGGATDIYP